jgi:amicoumacin kinase
MAGAREWIEPAGMRATAEQLAQRWSDAPIAFVRNFANAVYRLGDAHYLRLTAESHRSEAQIRSELELLRAVDAAGIRASQPVATRDGELVHAAELAGVGYCAVLFEQAPGRPFDARSDFRDEALLRHIGQTMGELHRALRDFAPSPGFTRFDWREDRWRAFPECVPRSEAEAWAAHDRLMAWIESLPAGPAGAADDGGAFGFVHGDFTLMNFRVEQGRIGLFDFDACCAHFHAYELATFLHVFGPLPQDARRRVYDAVLDGYSRARPVGVELLRQIPRFGQLRLLYSFLVFAQEWGFDRLSAEQHAYFELRRRLLAGPPVWPEP